MLCNRRTALLPATVVCVLVACVIGAGAQVNDVKLLDMLNTKDPAAAGSIKAYKAGVKAALYAHNNMVASGQNLRLIEVNPDVTVTDVPAAITQAMTTDPDILAVLGPASDDALLFALQAMRRYNLVALGPYTSSTEVRYWEPHFYFLRTGPMAGLYANLWYAVSYLRVYRLGFMYLTDVKYGGEEYNEAQLLLKGMGYQLCCVFSLPGTKEWSATDAEFQRAWEMFVAGRPQAVIIFGKPSQTTSEFIRKMLHDPRTADAYLLGPLALQATLISTWKDAIAAGVPFVPGQIITTGANPLASDLRYEAIKRFHTVMTDYLTNSGQTDYQDPRHFLKNAVDGELMVGGWIVGDILTQVLAAPEWIASRQSFAQSLFAQRRYVIDDLIIGDFGAECHERAMLSGAICECNQGGRVVLIKTFGANFDPVTNLDDEFAYALYDCYPNSVRLYTPLNSVTFLLTDSKRAMYATEAMQIGERAGIPAKFVVGREFTLTVLTGTRATAMDLLTAEKSERRTEFFIGASVDGLFETPNMVFMDPINVFPEPRVAQRNVIYLTITLDQELYRLAHYLSASSVTETHAIISGPYNAAIADVLRRTLVVFGIELKSVRLCEWVQKPMNDLPREGWVFVIGIRTDEIMQLLAYVEANPDLHVMIPYSDYALLYESLFSLQVSGTTDRVLFATNMPHWADRDSIVPLVQKYHEEIHDSSQWSPLSLHGFAATTVIQSVAGMMDIVTPGLFLETLYLQTIIDVDGMVYGPFKEKIGSQCTDVSTCLVNYGATLISVWSLSRSIDPSITLVSPPVTLEMDYTVPTQHGLTKAQLAGIIVGCVFLVIALVVIPVVVFLFCCRDSRDNANAPKTRTDPVTLVFTDIESSTALWAACPELMPDAVATHHRLIRALIAKYRCYEVKTIGDSFMIACKSPFAAVQLAGELQRVFLNHDWGTSAIDDAYHRFEEDRAAEDDEYVPPTARLDAAVYEQYWRGLRVRVGMHTGLADIRHDEVTKGYDYYGGTSNTAARTESVANGGQVVLTRATYLALSTAERELVSVTALGAVPLRGVPRPVEMYQLDAVPGRTFAALRLDREMDDLDGDDGADSEFSLNLSQNLSMYGGASRVAAVLRTLLGAYPIAERLRVVTRMCERWNVRVGRVGRNVAVEDHVSRALDRLAVRLGQVLQRVGGGETPRFGVSQTTSDRRFFGWGASVTSDVMSLLGPEGLRDDDEDQWAASTAASDSVSTVRARKPRYWNFSRK